jgi:ferric iron reductase protein FhuF
MKGWQALAACLDVVTLRVEPGTETIPLQGLTDPAILVPLVERFGRSYPEGDRRAVASMWVKYYGRMVLSPLIACSVRDRAALLDPIGGVSLILTGNLPYGLLIPASPAPDRTLERIYGTGLRDHMAAVFDALHAGFRLSPRVSWANAGVLADHVLGALLDDPELGARAREDREQVIAARINPWFPVHNPLFEPVRIIPVEVDGRTVAHKQQRVCCIRDRIPDMPLCGNCPKLRGPVLQRMLREATFS